MHSPRSNSVVRQGFTLAEVLVTVVVIGIAAAAVVPHVSGMSDMRSASAARMLLADMQYAQNESVVTQRPVTMTFNAADNSYTLTDADGQTMTHPVNKSPFVTRFADTHGVNDVEVLSADFGGGQSVTFDALGSPDNSGEVTLASDGYRHRVSIAAVTGKISVAVIGR